MKKVFYGAMIENVKISSDEFINSVDFLTPTYLETHKGILNGLKHHLIKLLRKVSK